jgi:hypothetical protein
MEKLLSRLKACSPTYKGKTTLSERSLKANYIQAGMQHCYEEFMYTHYDWIENYYTTQVQNRDTSELLSLLTAPFVKGISRDVENVMWFADADSTDDFYQVADGFFKRIEEIIANNSIGARVNSTQGTLLTPQAAFNLLQTTYENARPELRAMPAAEKRIHINGNLWYLIKRYLRENAVENGFITLPAQTESGITPAFEGVPIVVHHRWDDILFSDFNLNNQNRIIYTAKDNLWIGTDLRQNAAGSNALFEIYRDPVSKRILAESKFVLDMNFAWPELFSVAY